MTMVEKSNEPHDQLTRLADQIHDAVNRLEDYDGEKLIIFISSDKLERSGIGMFGYEDGEEMDAVFDLLMHIRAILRANGKDLAVLGLKR
jgi:hypothetical protein